MRTKISPLVSLLFFDGFLPIFFSILFSIILHIILPILAALSTELNINPLIVMIPAAISSSMAFMMPVATPPNAIIFSSKSITVYEMAKVGSGQSSR